jgi:hypothetical protein
MRAPLIPLVALTISACVTLCVLAYLTRQLRYLLIAALIALCCCGPNMIQVVWPSLAASLEEWVTWSLSPTGMVLRAVLAGALLFVALCSWNAPNIPAIAAQTDRTAS